MKGQRSRFAVSVCCSLLLLLATPPSEADPDPDVCIPGPPSGEGPPLPTLPNQYSLRVEANIQDKNYTMELQEFYDEPGNRGAAEYLIGGHTLHTSYDYITGQSITTFGDHCRVANMSTSPFNLYGFKLVDGHPHIGSVSDIFRFGKQYNETYIGQEFVRGILTNHWQNCMYVDGSNTSTTFRLDYYFTLPGAQTAGGGDEIPVRAVINGTMGDPLYSFYHVYEFHEVLPGPVHEYRAFEPPLGSYCENRTSEQPFPNDFANLDSFLMGVEVAIIEMKRIYNVYEYYNYQQKIVSYQYQDWGEGAPGDYYHEVHDYNMGLSFKTDLDKSWCSVGPISVDSNDAGTTDGQHVYLRSITNFLHLPDFNWVYEGKSKRRGVGAESWIAKTTDYPGAPGYTFDMTLEYFFTNETWQSPAKYHEAVNHVPLGLDGEFMIKQNGTVIDTFHLEESFFSVIYGGFDPFMVDVSICYDSGDSMELAVDSDVKYVYDDYVQNNTNNFYIGVINSLAQAANVSASRISGPQAIEGSGGRMTIYFKLLGIPPVKGDAVNMTKQISLEESYNNLDSAVSKGITIDFSTSKGEPVSLSVASDSLRADFYTPNVTTGYSLAAFAGVAAGMFVAGVLIAAGVAYLIRRKSGGGQFSYNVQNN